MDGREYEGTGTTAGDPCRDGGADPLHDRLIALVERSEDWLRARFPDHPALRILDDERERRRRIPG
jgi:hypothetical protein